MPSSILFTLVAGVLLASPLHAQPTFKLGVGSHLFPTARLELKGARVLRTVVQDDPGFRLQFHFLKDGKTAQIMDARGLMDLQLPHKEAGDYCVALELFYPSYKAGNEQKGMFKAISNFIAYRYQPSAKPGDPALIQTLSMETALVLACGKAQGKQQEEKLAKGWGYKLVQGTAAEPWPGAAKNYCWQDAKTLRFEITLPPETAGTIRLMCLDGDAKKRKQKVIIQGRPLPDVEDFAGAGKQLELPLSPAELKMGKIEVTMEALQAGETAVVSGIEFIPAFSVK